MSFSLPPKNNSHEDNGSGDALFAENIGSPNAVNTKEAGNLPITQDGSQFTITSDNTLAGASYYFKTSPDFYDVSSSTKVLLWHNQFNAPNRIQVGDLANGGIRFRLYSGTTLFSLAYKDWYIGGNDSPFAECIKGQVPFVIDLNAGNETSSAGTFDNTKITRYGLTIKSDFIVGTQVSLPSKEATLYLVQPRVTLTYQCLLEQVTLDKLLQQYKVQTTRTRSVTGYARLVTLYLWICPSRLVTTLMLLPSVTTGSLSLAQLVITQQTQGFN